MQLSVIIVNYNVKYFLEQCLYAVVNAIKNMEAEIIVIDNNSTDESKYFFSNKFANVYFIWNQKNVGFSKANNIAVQQAKGNYILFLNPDTIVPEDCFEKCIKFYKTQKDIGALGVRMIDGTGKFLKESKRGFPSLLTSFFKLSGLAILFPRSKVFARYYTGHLSENQNNVVDVLAGAFMLVEKKVLDITGGFDEQFFMYAEDIDLSYLIQKAGYKNYYFSETTIIHFKGESTKKGNLKYEQLFYGAMGIFVKKHYSGFKAALYSIFINTALWLKATANFIKKIFSSAKKTITSTTSLTVIVGSESDYQLVINLLNTADAKFTIIGRVDATKIIYNNTLGNLQALPAIIKSHAVETIIFCINQLSIGEIIHSIENIHSAVNYKFYTKGASSIVGSSNKNATGDCIVAPI